MRARSRCCRPRRCEPLALPFRSSTSPSIPHSGHIPNLTRRDVRAACAPASPRPRRAPALPRHRRRTRSAPRSEESARRSAPLPKIFRLSRHRKRSASAKGGGGSRAHRPGEQAAPVQLGHVPPRTIGEPVRLRSERAVRAFEAPRGEHRGEKGYGFRAARDGPGVHA